jgi:type II secretory pathway component PulF
MSGQLAAKPEYGNWVSKRLIYLSGFVGFVFLGLSLMFWVLIIPAVRARYKGAIVPQSTQNVIATISFSKKQKWKK